MLAKLGINDPLLDIARKLEEVALSDPYFVERKLYPNVDFYSEPKDHWENVYATKPTTEVSWFQPHAGRSVELLQRAGLSPGAALIDVGGGASTCCRCSGP